MALNRREGTERKLYTGILLGTPRGYVNPTKAQYGKMMGFEPSDEMEEFVYEDKDKSGNDRVKISFWLQAENHPDKPWFNIKFNLVNKPVFTKEKPGKVIRQQFVNQVGDEYGNTWVDKRENLPDWFTHYQNKEKQNIADKFHREAIQGEADLNLFLNKWYANVGFQYPVEGEYSSLLIDVKRLFRSVDKYVKDEYQPLLDEQNKLDTLNNQIASIQKEIEEETEPGVKDEKTKEVNKLKDQVRDITNPKNGSLLTGPVVALAVVGHGTGDNEGKSYQNLYRGFLSGRMLKKAQICVTTNNWNDKDLKKWYESATTGEYQISDSYEMCMLKEFDPSSHIQATNETFREEKSSTPEDLNY